MGILWAHMGAIGCIVLMCSSGCYTHLQEVELEELHMALCTMEAFLTAKLARIDPDFIAETDLISQ